MQKSVELAPQDAEAHSNFGVTLQRLSRLEEAEASFREAIAINSEYAEAHYNLGFLFRAQGRLIEAEMSYKKAITLQPKYSEAHYNLGNILRDQKKYNEAICHFDLANTNSSEAQSLECLYIGQDYVEFDRRLEAYSTYGRTNIRIAAISSFAAYERGQKDPYPFCTNPLDFICIDSLTKYYSHSDTFLDDLIKEADHEKLNWELRTTKFGFAGPTDVFEKSSKNVSQLEDIIRRAVDAYFERFGSESNVFIRSRPKRYQLNGWYNRLLKNGHHTSHIHPDGWLSGVIYLKTNPQAGDDEGAIEFGVPGYETPTVAGDHPTKLYRPKKGDIVLFPSSLFHRTIPFTTDYERWVIAFDTNPNER
jgi:uncharacterized protein (TIGR02466 family)